MIIILMKMVIVTIMIMIMLMIRNNDDSNDCNDVDIYGYLSFFYFQLKRLQGKRNRNEQINIIDINAADQTGDTQLQMTKITSEQIVHRPSKVCYLLNCE